MAAPGPGLGGNPGPNDPPWHAAAVIPTDSTDLPYLTTIIWVGKAGDMQVTMAGGETVVFPSLPAGWHAMRVRRIWNTNTKASGIVACWR